jgi:hypothetical protein
MKNGQHDVSAGQNRACKASFVLSKTISEEVRFDKTLVNRSFLGLATWPPDKRLGTGLSIRCRKAWGFKSPLAIFSFPSIYADLPRLVSRGAALCRPREFHRTHLLPTF